MTQAVKWLTLARGMFTSDERDQIERKALEQALRQAHAWHVELEPLLPVSSPWPFALSEHDRDFLRIQKIDPR